MRILLVHPPMRSMLPTVVPRLVEDGAAACPPLGLAGLASCLREAGFRDVAILDARAERLSPRRIGRRIERFAPDLVGVTANSFALLDVLLVLRAVRRHAPGAATLVGGPHATLFPAETSALAAVDLVLAGEAEESIVGQARALSGRGLREDVPGLWAGGARVGPEERQVEDLDALPLPARDLLPRRRYCTVHARVAGLATLLASRGCPWGCAFCHHAFGRRVRRRSPGSLAREMEEIARLGLRDVFFFDDTFTVDRAWVLRLCAELERRRLPLVFDVRTRVDAVDADLLAALARAGCDRISLGIESGSDRTLGRLRKGTTVEQARGAVRAARQAGLCVYADFMLGSPGETRDEALATIDLALELDPDFAQFSTTLAYPGTALYDEVLRQGRGDPWRAFAARPAPGFLPPRPAGSLPPEETDALVRLAWQRFYLRPRFAARQLGRLRSPGRAVAAARAGLMLARGIVGRR